MDCVDSNATGDMFATGGADTFIKLWSITLPDGQATENGVSNGGGPSKKKKQKQVHVAPTQTPLSTLAGHSEAVSGLVWADDDSLWACSFDHTIRNWDLELSGPKLTLPGSLAFTSLDFSEQSRLIVASAADPHVRLIDPRSKDVLVASMFRSHRGWVSSVKWSKVKGHLFVSGSYDQQVLMWDTRSPKAPLFALQGHNDNVLSVNWDRSDRILSSGADNAVNIFKC